MKFKNRVIQVFKKFINLKRGLTIFVTPRHHSNNDSIHKYVVKKVHF